MIIQDYDLATTPWKQKNFDVNDPFFLEWAYHARHHVLLRLIISSGILEDSTRHRVLQTVWLEHDDRLLNIIKSQNFIQDVDWLLKAAAKGGDLDVVNKLLAARADVNAEHDGRSALQAAAENGHLNVVETLFIAGVDVNHEHDGRTVLQTAAKGGHLSVVKKLLVAGADVNAPATSDGGRTALEAAEQERYLSIVNRLQRAGAR